MRISHTTNACRRRRPRPGRALCAAPVIASVVALLVAGCASREPVVVEQVAPVPSVPASAEGARHGGTLVVALAATSIATLDPAAYSDRATETVLRNIYDGLVTRTATNAVIPELARSYRWIDDRTVEFELQRDVIFHNGERFAADDVVFTFERILQQDIGAPRRSFVQEVDRVEAVDDYTVRFYQIGRAHV